jgi:hypothetical protein
VSPAIRPDYSHRSLFEKLGVRADAHVAVQGAHDPAFLIRLNAQIAKAASASLRARYDLVFVKVDAPRDLTRITRAAAHLRSDGALWVFHPKGRGARPSAAEVRAAGLAAGLVDNKICAYSDSHTALRFVIPLTKR